MGVTVQCRTCRVTKIIARKLLNLFEIDHCCVDGFAAKILQLSVR
jgi:hypothetical protein